MPRGRAGWISLLLSAFVLVAVVGAAACDDDDDDEEAAVATAPPATATAAPTEAPVELSATLAGQGGLEASGSVRLVPAGAGTRVEVSVPLHHGSCAA